MKDGVVRLNDIAVEFVSGGTPSTATQALWDGDIPWTTSVPIGEGDVYLSTAQRNISVAALSSSTTNLVPPDDLRGLARHWATRIGVKIPQLHLLRAMRSKWASMSTAGRLTPNTELLSLPRLLAEYVVGHELVHLLVPNHGKVFKSLLGAYLPDWREREQMLSAVGADPPPLLINFVD